MNGNPNMYYVGGSKGGVGKSLFSFALTDYLLNQERDVLLVDTDTDNPDVYKAHKDLNLPNLACIMNTLDDADGWAELFDTVQNYPAHTVVVNAAARTKASTTFPRVSLQQSFGRSLLVRHSAHLAQNRGRPRNSGQCTGCGVRN